jgi:benzoyl-CoA reductase subunit C
MDETLKRFRTLVESPYEKLAAWKEKSSRKVVACSPMHFPEELIHASGMLPVVLQETNEVITNGFSYIYPFYCGITRNMIDIASKGQLDFLDGIFYTDICIQARTGGAILRRILKKQPVFHTSPPMVMNRINAHEATANTYQRIKAQVEQMSGTSINDKSLSNSIAVYNRNRTLLHTLRELRKRSPRLISYGDLMTVVQASMLMPKEDHNELLEKLITSVKKAKAPEDKRKKVFLSGHLCQKPKLDIVDIVEEAGGTVIDDDLYTGFRYYAVDAGANGDPMQALVNLYIDKSLPVPTRTYPPLRWDNYLTQRVQESGAKGVVVLMV